MEIHLTKSGKLNNIKSPSTNCQGEVNHKLGSIVEDVDANGYPPVEQYRKTISEFADQACGYGTVGIRGFSYKLTTFKHREGLKLEQL